MCFRSKKHLCTQIRPMEDWWDDFSDEELNRLNREVDEAEARYKQELESRAPQCKKTGESDARGQSDFFQLESSFIESNGEKEVESKTSLSKNELRETKASGAKVVNNEYVACDNAKDRCVNEHKMEKRGRKRRVICDEDDSE